jgi:hypothetical protein
MRRASRFEMHLCRRRPQAASATPPPGLVVDFVDHVPPLAPLSFHSPKSTDFASFQPSERFTPLA